MNEVDAAGRHIYLIHFFRTFLEPLLQLHH